MQRPLTSSTQALPSYVARDSHEWNLFPLLMAHCHDEAWDDGSPRTTSTLMFFSVNNSWRAMLKNRAEDTVAFVTSQTIEGCLVALESGLAGSGLDWRRDQKPGQKGKRK